ncbi:hypothetical protein AXK11_09100 [Cephaloticoccus primus]|uniref:Uncharacterized protein n=1 Tax=Cephaloticoccus primus TaxID=1548207 RepID=A0A139SHR3_9BACT|nr:hypothetical protein AXK11_09100 [Cephaloticoccus primus]
MGAWRSSLRFTPALHQKRSARWLPVWARATPETRGASPQQRRQKAAVPTHSAPPNSPAASRQPKNAAEAAAPRSEEKP